MCYRMADEPGIGSSAKAESVPTPVGKLGKAEEARGRRTLRALDGTSFTITCGPGGAREEIARVCGVRPEVVEICGDQLIFVTKRLPQRIDKVFLDFGDCELCCLPKKEFGVRNPQGLRESAFGTYAW